jgi:hypothetical protein
MDLDSEGDDLLSDESDEDSVLNDYSLHPKILKT